jgi:hypothetical protein
MVSRQGPYASVEESNGNRKFFHDYVIESGRPLRPSENATVCERQFHRCCSDGTGFSNRGRAHQPSARKREPASPSGPKRKPLGRASARRHLCRVQAGYYCSERVNTLSRVLLVCFHCIVINRCLNVGRARESGGQLTIRRPMMPSINLRLGTLLFLHLLFFTHLFHLPIK